MTSETETADDPTGWLIWSDEHGMWWSDGGRGYTKEVSEAGRFTREEAEDILARAGPERKLEIVANPAVQPKPTRHQQRVQRLRDVHIWLEPEIYQRLKKGADKDGRSTAQMARQLIIKGMKGMARV